MLDISETRTCAIVEKWLEQLEQALAQPSSQSLDALFLSQSYWRDVLALTSNIQTLCGAGIISDAISKWSKDAGLSNIQVELADMPPRQVTRVGTETIEAFFIFDTSIGRGRGIVRLCPDSADGERYKAWTFLTALEGLNGYEETTDANRPTGRSYLRDFHGPNWLDERREGKWQLAAVLEEPKTLLETLGSLPNFSNSFNLSMAIREVITYSDSGWFDGV